MSDAGSIIRESSIRKNVKYTPLFKKRRGSDESKVESDKKSPSCAAHTGRIVGLVVVMLLFALSLLGTIVMWATDLYDSTINERLVLRNNSDAFEAWRKSPVKPIMRFRVFNYTNLEAFRSGDDARLRVAEVGPYTFRETTERVDVVFNSNGTITYRDKRTYEFLPELSVGSLNDTLMVINVPLMTLNYMNRNSGFLQRVPIATALRFISPQPLHQLTAHQLFWGYEDTLTKMAAIRVKDVRVGLLQQKNGTSPYTITIHSGQGNLSRLGEITMFDGKSEVDYYSTDECNRVDGSDGTKFAPPLVRQGGTLYIYHRDVCRRVPLEYKEEVKVFRGVPALRFVPPKNILDDGDSNPENSCYCIESSYDVCQPSGVMGTSNCKKDAPIYASFPHFYLGDSILLDAVEGLKPEEEKHSMYMDINQKLGVPVAMRSRFQFNVLVRNPFNNFLLKELDEKLLPMVWLQRELEEFPEDLQKLFYMASVTVEQVRDALKYGSLVLAVLTGATLLVLFVMQMVELLRSNVPPVEVYVMTRL